MDEGKTILLVEDEAVIALDTKRMLQKNGYRVVVKHSGEAAVKAVDTEEAVDLILMDINLGTGISGTEAAEKILTKHDVPLIFLSSHTGAAIVEKTQGITSYGYIYKKSGFHVLLASIRMAFRLHEAKKKEMEKDLLLQEAYQRVKHNLLLVRSLLLLKEASCGVDLGDVVHQIDTIKLIQEQLNDGEEVSKIPFKRYCIALLGNVFQNGHGMRVHFEVIMEDILIDTKTAAILGLLIHEVALNAVKHGFVNGGDHRFELEFSKAGPRGGYRLNMTNNGRPIPDEISLDSPSTLGLMLVRSIVEQLDGKIEICYGPYPEFNITFGEIEEIAAAS